MMQKKRVFLLTLCLAPLLAAVLFPANTPAAAQGQTASVSFKSPEDAITAYIQGFAKGDTSKILQACAVDEMSSKLSFTLYTARIGALLPYVSPAPSDYPFYADMNKAQLSWQLLVQARTFAYGLLSTEDTASGKTITIDAARTAQFIKDVDPARLAQIQLKEIRTPKMNTDSTATIAATEAKTAHLYGADESTDRVALFSFESNYYDIAFTILRFGDNWKISTASSQMVGTPNLYAPGKTTVAEFESQFN